jgi:mono/diheme cytochrome c family protein
MTLSSPHRFRLALAAVLAALPTLMGCDPPDTRGAAGRPDGRKLYALYCATCHGPDGTRRTGSTTLAAAAVKPAAALRSVVEHGRSRMPPWKNLLLDDQITALVDTLKARSLEQTPARRVARQRQP